MINTISKIVVLFLCSTFFISCGDSNKTNETPNTPTSGQLTVFCEEGFSLHVKNQAYTFERIYDKAKINVNYVTEKQAVEALFKGDCKAMIISRTLSKDELKKFNAANVNPTQTCIGYSAVAFVVSYDNIADSVITLEELKKLLSGEDTSRNIVFDNENSGTTRFLKDSMLQGKPFGKNCFALKTTNDLIKHISQNKKSIGVLDYAWLSDTDDIITQQFLQAVKPIAVATKIGNTAYMPDQSNIQTKNYPLCRYVYATCRSTGFNLASGFVTFVAGPKGQLMLLKQGLIPSIQPGRVVEINTAPLK